MNHSVFRRCLKGALVVLLLVPFACDEGPTLSPVDTTRGRANAGGARGIGAGDPTLSVALGAAGAESMPMAQLATVCATPAGESRGDASGSLTIDDFEDGDAGILGNGLHGVWFGYGDGSSEQTPQNPWAPVPRGRRGSEFAAHIAGGGYNVWGSGNATLFSTTESNERCVFDATAYDGIVFWARGFVRPSHPDDGTMQPSDTERGKLRVHVVERDVVPLADGGGCPGSCWDAHKARVELTSCWKKHVLPFSLLAPDGYGHSGGELDLDQLYSLAFEVSAHQDFEYWLDDISFYVGDAPGEETECVENTGGAGGAGGSGN